MIRVQLSRIPDGAGFFCIARTVHADSQGYHTPPRIHAIGIGCALAHASELVYADGLDLANLDAAVPVGLSCQGVGGLLRFTSSRALLPVMWIVPPTRLLVKSRTTECSEGVSCLL